MTDWRVWHGQYADPASSLHRRLAVVQRILSDLVDPLGPQHRILSLCAGDGRDIIPLLAGRPPQRRPQLVLVELDPDLSEAARSAADESGVDATVVVGDAGIRSHWDNHLPADLLMLCGIFGNIADEDVETTIRSAGSLLSPDGVVIWTRGAVTGPDRRQQTRDCFRDCGFDEVAFESEPHGYGVGANRASAAVTRLPVPDRIFTFIR